MGDAKNVLVVGCGTCVTVCFAGGAREAAIVASSLRMATRLDGQPARVTDVTVQRQCEWEYLDEVAEQVASADVVLSLGCGIGVQAMAEHFPQAWVVPGLNTSFLGLPTEQGVWAERCAACGDCVLGPDRRHLPHRPLLQVAAQRPVRRLRERALRDRPDVPCAWQLIYDRLSSMGKLDMLLHLQAPKNWQHRPRRRPAHRTREDLRLAAEEE
jgi:ferredoxin